MDEGIGRFQLNEFNPENPLNPIDRDNPTTPFKPLNFPNDPGRRVTRLAGYPISFWRFLAVDLPVMVGSKVISTLYLWLCFFL